MITVEKQLEMCEKDKYEMMKNHWYYGIWTVFIPFTDDVPILRHFGYWKKFPYPHWSEFYCFKHKKGHKRKKGDL